MRGNCFLQLFIYQCVTGVFFCLLLLLLLLSDKRRRKKALKDAFFFFKKRMKRKRHASQKGLKISFLPDMGLILQTPPRPTSAKIRPLPLGCVRACAYTHETRQTLVVCRRAEIARFFVRGLILWRCLV